MSKRFSRYTLFGLFVLLLTLTACGQGSDAWPGISETEDGILVAYKKDVVRLDQNNQRIWRYEGDADFYAQPVVTDGRVYVGDTKGNVYALDYETGEVIWTYTSETTEFFFLSFGRRDRVLAPIGFGGNLIYFGDEYGVSALRSDTDSPELVWEYETNHGVWAQPLYVSEENIDDLCPDVNIDWESDWNIEPTLFVASLDKSLYALNPENGDLRWSLDVNGAVAGNIQIDCLRQRLYVGTLGSEVLAIDIRTSEVIDSVSTNGWVWGSPVIVEKDGAYLLYFVDLSGYVYEVALTADGFADDVFSRSLSEEPLRASPLVVEDLNSGDTLLVIGSDDENVYAVKIGPGPGWVKDRELNTRWTLGLDGRAVTELALIEGELNGEPRRLIVIGTDKDDNAAVGINLADGNRIDGWTYSYGD